MNKPEAQLSLESVLKTKREQAGALLAEADRIEREMEKILSAIPAGPQSSNRLVEAYSAARSQPFTMPVAAPASAGPVSTGPDSDRAVAEREVIYAAMAICYSWKRRHKKTYANQEKELMNAVERLTWDK